MTIELTKEPTDGERLQKAINANTWRDGKTSTVNIDAAAAEFAAPYLARITELESAIDAKDKFFVAHKIETDARIAELEAALAALHEDISEQSQRHTEDVRLEEQLNDEIYCRGCGCQGGVHLPWCKR